MATLHNFSRSLEPIKEFDDDGLSRDSEVDTVASEVVPYRDSNASNGISSDVILAAFIDHLCCIYEKIPEKREKLFHLICKELRKARIPMLIHLNDSLRRQMRDGFAQLLQAAMQSISQDITVASTSSLNQQSIVPFLSPPRGQLVPQLSINLVECVKQTAKLLSEFENIKPMKGGKGAFGQVFTVTKKSDGVHYALKKIKIKHQCGVAVLSSIRREVEILARLSHPNVVRYYDSWEGYEPVPPDSDSEEDDSDSASLPVQRMSSHKGSGPRPLTHFLYIQMELCTGTLKDWLSERITRGINYDDSYQIAKQILKGVNFIHAEHYFHRDLKPLNIFLSKNSTSDIPNIKIGDFGLARNMVLRAVDNAGTQEVHFTADVGTPHYGAPEQLNGSDYSEKSDMFSVGLILYELYYAFGTDAEKMHIFGKLRKNEEMDEEFVERQPVVALCIRRLTAKNPSDRPSAAEVLKVLREHRSSLEASDDLVRGHLGNQRYDLLELRRQLSERDDLLDDKYRLLVAKDRLLEEKDRLLEEKDQEIFDLRASNSAAEKKIFELQTLLQNLIDSKNSSK